MFGEDLGRYYPLAYEGATAASSITAMKAPYVDTSIPLIGNGTPVPSITSKAISHHLILQF